LFLIFGSVKLWKGVKGQRFNKEKAASAIKQNAAKHQNLNKNE
jgi:hypothetical protein